jgi:dolichyl-phosphate-mannose--protein O-mannosyl transferase
MQGRGTALAERRPPQSGEPVSPRHAWLGGDRFWGWAAPALIALFGGVIRLWNLGSPHKLIFDETYYVKEADSLLRFGVEMGLRASLNPDEKKRNEAADKLFNAGQYGIHGPDPEFVVHPPAGKWMIAAGEWLFGPGSSWGWRFSAAVAGTASILMIGRIARRLFGSTLLGAVAALLLAVDGEELVHSRVSILDIFVMFWSLAAFGCLLIDRDRTRARLTAWAARAPARSPTGILAGLGPWSGPRWWRVAGVACLALCTGVKWSGLYFAAVFLLMSVLWDCAARRAAGVRYWIPGGFLRDGLQALATAIVVLPVLYTATWAGWLASDKGWGRHWAGDNPATGVWGYVPDALRGLWHYHHEMWVSASGITTPHDWQANPWAWLVLGRPTLFLNDITHSGQPGCAAPTCNQMITDLGNPLIWWPGTLALGVLLYRWALARDWRAGAALSGVAGGYLPWFQYQHRTIFEFYTVAFLPWMIFGVTYCLGLVIGPADGDPERRRRRTALAGAYVVAVVLAGWYFYPITAGEVIPAGGLELRRWLTSWF